MPHQGSQIWRLSCRRLLSTKAATERHGRAASLLRVDTEPRQTRSAGDGRRGPADINSVDMNDRLLHAVLCRLQLSTFPLVCGYLHAHLYSRTLGSYVIGALSPSSERTPYSVNILRRHGNQDNCRRPSRRGPSARCAARFRGEHLSAETWGIRWCGSSGGAEVSLSWREAIEN